jgi:hypothetical protein
MQNEDRAQALTYLKALFPDQFICLIVGDNCEIDGEPAVQTFTVTNLRDNTMLATILNAAAMNCLENPAKTLEFGRLN